MGQHQALARVWTAELLAINVRIVKGIPRRQRSWDGAMPIIHTLLRMKIISGIPLIKSEKKNFG
jgi:hypothetical protein